MQDLNRHICNPLGLVLAVLVSSLANAQFDPTPYYVTPAEFARQVQALTLSSENRQLAETWYDAYDSEFHDTCTAYETIDAWHDSNRSVHTMLLYSSVNNAVEEDRRRLIRTLHEQLRNLECSHFDALDGLTSDTTRIVATLRRTHLRQRITDHDRRLQWNDPSASVDLIAVMANVHARPAGDERVRAILAEYEVQLDVLLRQIDEQSPIFDLEAQAALRALARRSSGGLPPDSQEVERIARVYSSPMELGARVSALNKGVCEQLVTVLPDAEALHLRVLTARSMHGYLYQQDEPTYLSRLQRLIAAGRLNEATARTLADLRGTLLDLHEGAAREIDPLLERRFEPRRLRTAWQRWTLATIEGTSFQNDPAEEDFEREVDEWRRKLEPYKSMTKQALKGLETP